MPDQTYCIESRFKKGVFVLVSLGALFFLFLSAMVLKEEAGSIYHNIMDWVLSALMTGFAVTFIIVTLLSKKLRVYDDRIEVFSLFGNHTKTIYRSEIEYWAEKETHNNHRSTTLTIYTDNNGKLSINTTTYNNYAELSESIKRGKPQKPETMPIAPFIFAVVAGLAFLSLAAYCYSTAKDVAPLQLTYVKGTLANEAELTKGSKGRRYIEMELTEYPGYNFKIEDIPLDATNVEAYTSEVHTGDQLTLGVEESEYKQDLQTIKAPGSWVMPSDLGLDVFSLESNGNKYLSFPDYFDSYMADQKSTGHVWGTMALGLGCIAIGIFYLVRRNKKLQTMN